ncbi:MAG TPA: hypothetical protein VFF02_02380, partial [Anaeromyxobacteraceae bacterium]|nr:hypothetical protein [Anaeromyxobacteraceae bacterium]
MTRPRLAAAALLLAAGCPLPQSVPSVPPGSVTPPRIVEDASRPSATDSALTTAGTTTSYDPGCANPQIFAISTAVADENFFEVVTYRWFVDYDPIDPLRYAPRPESSQLQPLTQEPFTPRPVPVFSITPASFPPSLGSGLHVLELVVSNGFDQSTDQASLPLPYRTPITGAQTYEVQSHKWVFVPSPGCANAPTPTCSP